VPVVVWHFIEHANRNDPDLADVLLFIGQVVLLGGALTAFVVARRQPRGGLSPG
jgi:hypothetical protein